MHNINGLRAVKLLRVSSDKQVGDDKDIPSQRKLVDEFIGREELTVVREFVESGISGFKTKISNRDALNTIKRMADNKEFDVLVVYKSDRIGRTSDESPLVVKYLNDKGIRIFTASGEEIKTESQFDKLITYLNFWQNETESVKLSERATDYHIVMTKEGRYRGGRLPYGYRLVNNGSQNFKGRNILDVEIDPEQAEIIKLIYDLSINHNMGFRAIAKYLNENGYKEKATNPEGWFFTTINSILNNPTYKGYFHMHSKLKNQTVLSEKQEHLVIIPEEIWELNQQVMKNRKTTEKKEDGTRHIVGITRGEGLLSGLVYCGHCGSKMHIWNNHKYYYRKNGEKVRLIKCNYRCKSAISSGKIKCDGQSTYSTQKIDSLVEEETIDFVIQLQDKKLNEEFKNNLLNNYERLLSEKKSKQRELEEKQKQLITLKKEIANALIGNSVFTVEELKESILLIQKDVDNLLKELNELDIKVVNYKNTLNEFENIDTNRSNWVEKYKRSDVMTKKQMLGNVIEKVIIFKDEVKIIFKTNWLEFQKNCSDDENGENNICNGSEIVPSALPNDTIALPIVYIEKTVKFKLA